MVAMHADSTMRISPEGRRTVVYLPSLAMICAETPAERTIWPPLPGFSSMLCTWVPSGMLPIGIALPGRTSTFSPDITVSPTARPTGARM